MKKNYISPRHDKNEKLENTGFTFHGLDDYWQESRYYEFTSAQIRTIEKATSDLHQMSLEAVEYVIKNKLMSQMAIPEIYHDRIIASRHEPSVYGRFDFCYDGVSPPKMLEYNADTPISLLETSLAQKQWQQDVFPQHQQYNYIHDKLVKRWKDLGYKNITFTGVNSFEDMVCLNYILQTAHEAGINCDLSFVDDITYNYETQYLHSDKDITHLFKIYPYEWLMNDDFGLNLINTKTKIMEPMWKCILSNKAILPILYEMFPKSEYLLPAYYTPNSMPEYCKKPFFSREGSNIEVVSRQHQLVTDGPYGGDVNYIYQKYHELPLIDGYYCLINSWIIGDEPAGMYLRECKQVVTDFMSYFIPHIIVD